jgi:glycerol-1-phosphate dehydrogenase [NAD(P)+]
MAYLQGQDWEKIRASLKELGAPTTAEGIGASQEIIIKALLKAKDMRDRYTVLNEKPLNEESAARICKKVGVF